MRAALKRGVLWLPLVLLAGCADLDSRYGPKSPEPPAPVSIETYAVQTPEGRDGALIVAGGDGRRALNRPEFYGTAAPVPRTGRATLPQNLAPGEEGVSLNFVQTEIADVVEVVLGQILEVNYTIDPRVQGAVTTRTVHPISERDLVTVLENILAANGAALVRTGATVSVVPVAVARSLPPTVVTTVGSAEPRGFGTYFIPLRHAEPQSLIETVQSQIGPDSQLAAAVSRNMLIFTGPESEARAVEEMVQVLDVDLLAGRSFALLPLDAAEPAVIAAEIGALGGASGTILPIERMNAVLAVASSPSQLRQLASWVARLDRADGRADRDVIVYSVRHGLASDLAATVLSVFGGSAATPESDSAVAPGLDPVEIAFDENGNEIQTFDDTGPLLAAAPPAGTALQIVPNDARNVIVVAGKPAEVALVTRTLGRLDSEPTQVLIEATIAEVLLNDELEYGLRWAFESGDLSAVLTDSTAVGTSFPGFNVVLDGSDGIVVLRALSEITDVEVVSSPQVMVLDNQTARLQVGDQVPVTTREVVSVVDDTAPVVNAVSYFDTGVIFEVTPRVNADGVVTLTVNQEVSDAVRTETSDIDSPTIQQRRLSSTVAVQSGQTVALGGLIRDRRQEGESGIPVAKDIPLLGNLFKTTLRSGTRTELLVLITPRVVRNEAEARAVTEELRNRLLRLRQILPPSL